MEEAREDAPPVAVLRAPPGPDVMVDAAPPTADVAVLIAPPISEVIELMTPWPETAEARARTTTFLNCILKMDVW